MVMCGFNLHTTQNMKNNTNTVGGGFHPDPQNNKCANLNANVVGANCVRPKDSKPKSLTINITNLSEEQKAKLRGAIKFFSGDKNNIAINVKNNEQILPCGAIYLNKEILEQFEEIVGKENILFRA